MPPAEAHEFDRLVERWPEYVLGGEPRSLGERVGVHDRGGELSADDAGDRVVVGEGRCHGWVSASVLAVCGNGEGRRPHRALRRHDLRGEDGGRLVRDGRTTRAGSQPGMSSAEARLAVWNPGG
ncbi:hypothetical protein [Streptomyces sp. NPDC001893]|uniref:hypothetical protein n=1 Tax=Streptomyces sp. NPDC001893 TaxID=3154530 RepID=UPI003332D4CF